MLLSISVSLLSTLSVKFLTILFSFKEDTLELQISQKQNKTNHFTTETASKGNAFLFLARSISWLKLPSFQSQLET
jgi:hypothetical protein